MDCNLESLTAAARAKQRAAAEARQREQAQETEEALRNLIGADAFACLGKTWYEDGAVCFRVREGGIGGLFGLTRVLVVWREPQSFNPFGRIKPGSLVVGPRYWAGTALMGTSFANTDEFLLAVDRLR